MSQPSPTALEEFRALRATIRQRGTTRPVVALCCFIAWAALAFAVQTWAETPAATLMPLIVLAAGYEAVLALHVGVERIGRYLQVRYEQSDDGPRWEHTAPVFSANPAPPKVSIDPVFGGVFIGATFVNLYPVGLLTFGLTPSWMGLPVEFAVYGGLHVLFIARVIQGWRYARGQRARDLEALTR